METIFSGIYSQKELWGRKRLIVCLSKQLNSMIIVLSENDQIVKIQQSFQLIMPIKHQVNVIMELLNYEVSFNSKFKIQLAFYRGSKIAKTDPHKYVDPSQSHIPLNKQLPVSTTLYESKDPGENEYVEIYRQSVKSYFQKKEINLQVAYEIDAEKKIFEEKIWIHEFINSSAPIELKVSKNFSIKCNVKVCFMGVSTRNLGSMNQSNQPQIQKKTIKTVLGIQNSKNKVRSSSRAGSTIQKSPMKQGTNQASKKTDQQLQTKSAIQKLEFNHHLKSKKERKENRSNTLLSSTPNTNRQEQKLSDRKIVSNSKQELMVKNDKEIEDPLQKSPRSMIQSNIAQKRRNKSYFTKFDQNDKQVSQNLISALETEKQNVKKKQNQVLQLEMQIQKYKSNLQKQKNRIFQLQRLNKNYYQLKINSLQGTVQSLSKGTQQQKKKFKGKITRETDKDYEVKLMSKIQNADKEISALTKKMHQLQYQSNLQIKQNSELKKEISELRKQNQQLKNKNEQYKNKMKESEKSSQSVKNSAEEVGNLNKTKILVRELQAKQNLHRTSRKLRIQKETEQQLQIQSLKKRVEQLTKQIHKSKQKSKNNLNLNQEEEMNMMVAKVQNDKMKKQVERMKKNQTNILKEKSSLGQKCKEMEDQLIKCKQKIANLLNYVYQHGDQDLIEGTASLI